VSDFQIGEYFASTMNSATLNGGIGWQGQYTVFRLVDGRREVIASERMKQSHLNILHATAETDAAARAFINELMSQRTGEA